MSINLKRHSAKDATPHHTGAPNSIIDDILRQFAPKVPRGRGSGDWTEDEYAAEEILAQESREADWLEQQRALEEEKEAAEPDFLLKPWTTEELEAEIERRRKG